MADPTTSQTPRAFLITYSAIAVGTDAKDAEQACLREWAEGGGGCTAQPITDRPDDGMLWGEKAQAARKERR